MGGCHCHMAIDSDNVPFREDADPRFADGIAPHRLVLGRRDRGYVLPKAFTPCSTMKGVCCGPKRSQQIRHWLIRVKTFGPRGRPAEGLRPVYNCIASGSVGEPFHLALAFVMLRFTEPRSFGE